MQCRACPMPHATSGRGCLKHVLGSPSAAADRGLGTQLRTASEPRTRLGGCRTSGQRTLVDRRTSHGGLQGLRVSHLARLHMAWSKVVRDRVTTCSRQTVLGLVDTWQLLRCTTMLQDGVVPTCERQSKGRSGRRALCMELVHGWKPCKHYAYPQVSEGSWICAA